MTAKIQIVPFEPKHLEQIKLRFEYERPAQIAHKALTFLMGEIPIAIVGGVLLLPGVMQVWALTSDEVRKCPAAFHRATSKLVEFIFTVNQLRRMQFTVNCEYQQGWKWARALGFACEGVMKNYGVQGNHWLFARVAT